MTQNYNYCVGWVRIQTVLNFYECLVCKKKKPKPVFEGTGSGPTQTEFIQRVHSLKKIVVGIKRLD